MKFRILNICEPLIKNSFQISEYNQRFGIINAEIIYFRKNEKNDELDKVLFNAIKSVYEDVKFKQELIDSTTKIEELKKIYDYARKDTFALTLSPDLSGIDYRVLSTMELYGLKFELDLFYHDAFTESRLSKEGCFCNNLPIHNNIEKVDKLEKLFNYTLCKMDYVVTQFDVMQTTKISDKI